MHVPSVYNKYIDIAAKRCFEDVIYWAPINAGTLHCDIVATVIFNPTLKMIKIIRQCLK
jgi:hypothetical protein